MTVQELILVLREMNPNAEVTLTDPMRESPVYPVSDVFVAGAGNVVIAYAWEDEDQTTKLLKTMEERGK